MLPNMLGGALDGWAARDASRVDNDQNAAHLYQNHQINTEDEGTKAHTAMHGFNIFFMLGQWLSLNVDFSNVLAVNNNLIPIPKGDFGK